MLCKILTGIFAALYALALLIFLTGTYGWFGQETDPLSGIFLLPLAMPWVLLDLPDPYNRYFAMIAPILNIAILWFVCRFFRSR